MIKRLTRYIVQLQYCMQEGMEWVSSKEIAQYLGLTSSTVRQDISHVDFSGISKRGYEVRKLSRVLENLLGVNSLWKLVVVGAGNLGKALALHEEFGRRGFKICGIFDTDVRKIGKKVGKLEIRSLKELPKVVGKEHVDIGVIAVPGSAAQSVADILIASGIKGLLNLTLTHIITPSRIPVTDSRVVANLMELTHAVRSLQDNI